MNRCCEKYEARIAELLKDLDRTQEVCLDVTARAEALAVEVRQWRICINQDENKPFEVKNGKT